MDFIKTSSLRALIELTFQRNWNGLIWMSRKGVITKRVKTVQTALSRTAPKPRSPAGRETCSALGQITSVRLKSRPKFQTDRPITHTTRETLSRGRPSQRSRHTAHDQSARAGKQASRPRNRSAYHGRCIRPSRERTSHVRPRILIGQISSLDHAGRPRIRPTPTVPTRHDPMSGRSSRTTVPTPRSTRSPF
ncbi:unnamed protein product [Microthlaspi erraticum]|uniref:Uncharacterized protein n=1 Tax=Microthlaspi erraticum TaxID=1685480 RepID=A0A6D2J3N4_9BRAS|nr:unnamed protein product [Microthlaspi erraticum]